MGKIAKNVRNVLPKKWDRLLKDPRGHGVERSFSSILSTVMEGITVGCHNLRNLEELSELRGERLPDTTVWDLLVKVDAEPLKAEIARTVKAASRAHELDQKEGFPMHLTAIDGKNTMTTSSAVNDFSAPRTNQRDCPTRYAHQALRAFHVSSKLKLHLGQRFVAGDTNEMATLPGFLDELNELYGRTKLLEVISLDFGFMSAVNAQKIIDINCHYIISLKDAKSRKTTTAEAVKLLGKRKDPDLSVDEYCNGESITRNLYRCDTPEIENWGHAREFWRIEKITTSRSGKTRKENFYKISSIPKSKLTHKQVLLAIRLHWNIENNANWVLDTAWKEDTKPWCAKALELISLLRIIAFNAIARFKLRKLAKIKAASISWKNLLALVEKNLFPFSENSYPG